VIGSVVTNNVEKTIVRTVNESDYTREMVEGLREVITWRK